MAIKNGGNEDKNSAIRSSNIINNIHEFIKQEFINNSISPSKIHPAKSKTKPELELSGFLKTKKQDIAVIPSSPKKETITYNSILLGKTDKTGFEMSCFLVFKNPDSSNSGFVLDFAGCILLGDMELFMNSCLMNSCILFKSYSKFFSSFPHYKLIFIMESSLICFSQRMLLYVIFVG